MSEQVEQAKSVDEILAELRKAWDAVKVAEHEVANAETAYVSDPIYEAYLEASIANEERPEYEALHKAKDRASELIKKLNAIKNEYKAVRLDMFKADPEQKNYPGGFIREGKDKLWITDDPNLLQDFIDFLIDKEYRDMLTVKVDAIEDFSTNAALQRVGISTVWAEWLPQAVPTITGDMSWIDKVGEE